MTSLIDRIIQQAKEKGACALADSAHDLKSLALLFFSPQGREFCIKHNYPNAATFRQLKCEHLQEHRVFCDVGRFQSCGGKMYGLVGKTAAELKFNTINNYLVVLMHGAKATIYASNYAVVKIEVGKDCEVELINEDGTAKFL